MPGAALHFHFAGRVLQRWRACPTAAPFEIAAETENAFLHGALGPDMGYFPGAEPELSIRAHAESTGALCRALVAEARTAVETAFAWGWVTHVLADVAVHPLVNEACGEVLRGTRVCVWGDEAGTTHLRVETGLDALWCVHHPRLRRIRLAPALGAGGIAFLRRAWARTYGSAPAAEAFARSHRRVTRLAGPLAAVHALAGAAESPGALGAAAAVPLRVLSAVCPPASHARALFTPLAPAPWLRAEVDDIALGFVDWFEGHYVSGLQFLRDHSLDTGEIVGPLARAA